MASSSVKRIAVVSREAATAINNLESMWSQVDSIRTRIIGECLHARPENSFTRDEYCQRFGVIPATAKDHLANMVRLKLVKQVKVMLPNKVGSIVAHNVYIPLPATQ